MSMSHPTIRNSQSRSDTVAHSTQDLIRALRDIESNLTHRPPRVEWRWHDDAAVWAIATPNVDDVLELIYVQGGLRFEITQHGMKRKIACAITDDALLKDAKTALGRRIVVEAVHQLVRSVGWRF